MKTNICCAFQESEKANFQFFSSSTFVFYLFPQAPSQPAHSQTHIITTITMPHFESLAFMSTLCQE